MIVLMFIVFLAVVGLCMYLPLAAWQRSYFRRHPAVYARQQAQKRRHRLF